VEISRTVQEALRQGLLSHRAQGELARLIETARGLSEVDYRALCELRTAIEFGSLRVASRREFSNVMEQIVSEEIETQLVREGDDGVDRGDLLCFALNRLPPLYATTDVGAHYQRGRARRELATLVTEQVSVALHRARARPENGLERRPLGESAGEPLLRHIASLLNRFAVDYELPD
jgi:hypothetical protein